MSVNSWVPKNNIKCNNLLVEDRFFETHLIKTTISGDRNVIKKEAETFFKIWRPYSINAAHVERETRCDVGNNRGATGTVSKQFGKYLNNIPGKHNIRELQITAISDTAHILRRVLM